MTAHEKAILTYEALQKRKVEIEKGKMDALDRKFEAIHKAQRRRYRQNYSTRGGSFEWS